MCGKGENCGVCRRCTNRYLILVPVWWWNLPCCRSSQQLIRHEHISAFGTSLSQRIFAWLPDVTSSLTGRSSSESGTRTRRIRLLGVPPLELVILRQVAGCIGRPPTGGGSDQVPRPIDNAASNLPRERARKSSQGGNESGQQDPVRTPGCREEAVNRGPLSLRSFCVFLSGGGYRSIAVDTRQRLFIHEFTRTLRHHVALRARCHCG